MSASVVLIAPADTLAALRERFASGAEIRVFADVDAIQALDHIVEHKPQVIALEEEFSATPRGTALVNRIRADPMLAGCEVRVVARDGQPTVAAVRPVPRASDDEELDHRGTRRVPRVRIGDDAAVLVDGIQVVLVDLSVLGAQIVSNGVLKPNQRVRLALSDSRGTIRCQGSIAWASFEMPKNSPNRYRAGIEFKSADAEAVSSYAERHKHR